jgi:hypothetical protein
MGGCIHSSKLNLRQEEWSDYLKSLGNDIHASDMYMKDVVQPHINQKKKSDGGMRRKEIN